MNKFTLLIDGNYFLYSTLSVMQVFSPSNTMFLKTHDDEENRISINNLLDKLATIYAKDVRSLGALIDDVVIAVDDPHSWRKDIIIQKDYIGIESLNYKGNRGKDASINFNLIFKVFDDFLKALAITSNVKFKSISGCEADDLLFVHSSYLNSKGKNVLIYSGDGDIKQCVGYNKSTNAFTMLYQKQNKKIWVDRTTGIFFKNNKSSYDIDCIRSVLSNTSSKLSLCDAYEVVFEKILGGDSGDNVSSIIMEKRKYLSGKKKGQEYTTRVSKTIIDKIKKEIEFEKYNIQDLFRHDFIKKIAYSTIRNFKTQNKYNVDDLINNIDVNMNLVLLHKEIIPTELYDNIITWSEDIQKKKKSNIKNQFQKGDIILGMKMFDKREFDNSSSASIFKGLGL